MSSAWTAVIAVGAATAALKAAGPVILGGRPLPPKLARVIDLLAPAVLAGLVATQVLGEGGALVLDERALGLAAAAAALALRAPTLLVVVTAAATTALARALL